MLLLADAERRVFGSLVFCLVVVAEFGCYNRITSASYLSTFSYLNFTPCIMQCTIQNNVLDDRELLETVLFGGLRSLQGAKLRG